MATDSDPEELMTTSEVAAYLGMTPGRVRHLAKRIPGKKLGRDWVFRRADVVAFKQLPRPRGHQAGKPSRRKQKQPGEDAGQGRLPL